MSRHLTNHSLDLRRFVPLGDPLSNLADERLRRQPLRAGLIGQPYERIDILWEETLALEGRAGRMIARAEKLYPQTSDLPEAKAMLDKVKRGAISIG